MKKTSTTLSLSALLLSLSFANPALATPKPDLVITAFGLTSWGTCAPGNTVFTFSVTVKNKGNASWSSGGQEPAVVVKDMHPGVLDAWGVGIGIDPPLQPGKSKTLVVAIPYYDADPTHMTAHAPHPFQAVVNPKHPGGGYSVVESNYANNAGPGPALWKGIRVIQVAGPKGCPQ